MIIIITLKPENADYPSLHSSVEYQYLETSKFNDPLNCKYLMSGKCVPYYQLCGNKREMKAKAEQNKRQMAQKEQKKFLPQPFPEVRITDATKQRICNVRSV